MQAYITQSNFRKESEMKKITAFLLLLAFVGVFFISVACGGSGYEGGDPKNAKAKEAAGISTPSNETAPTPTAEGGSTTEAPADMGEGE